MRHTKRGIALAVLLCLSGGLVAARGDEEAPAKKREVDKKEAAARVAVDQKQEAAAKKIPEKRPALEDLVEEPAVVEDFELLDNNLVAFQNGIVLQNNQIRPQVRKLYKVELAYADRVCDMSPEQQKQVAAAAVESIDAFLKKFGNNNKFPRGGGFIVNGINGQPTLNVDQRMKVQAEIKRLVDTHLRPEQAARYLDEVTKQEEQFRRATAQLFVARIDEKLSLSVEQRARLLKALDENWREQYRQTVEILLQNHQFVPQIASGPLMPILDAYQKEVWQTLQKLGPQNFGMFGMGGDNPVVDDFALPDDEEPAKAAPADGAFEFEAIRR